MTDHDPLRAAVAAGNIPTLLLVVYLLGGERRWLADRYRPLAGRGTDDNDSGGLPTDVQDEIRAAALDLIGAVLSGERNVPPPPSLEDLAELMSISVGEHVSDEYVPMMAEEMGFTERRADAGESRRRADGLLGAGHRGGAVGHLSSGSISVERASPSRSSRRGGVGGTWHENTYPGCGVDTPSHLYSLLLRVAAPDWQRYFAKQPEIAAYLGQLRRPLRRARAHPVRHRRSRPRATTRRRSAGT